MLGIKQTLIKEFKCCESVWEMQHSHVQILGDDPVGKVGEAGTVRSQLKKLRLSWNCMVHRINRANTGSRANRDHTTRQ